MSSVKNIKHRCCQLNVQCEEPKTSLLPTECPVWRVWCITFVTDVNDDEDGAKDDDDSIDDDGDDDDDNDDDDGRESCLYYLRDTYYCYDYILSLAS